MLKLTTNSFSTHKEAESPDDCQDACARNDEERCYAVADGATRSFFSKEWAILLVEHFCETPDLSLVKKDWRDWIGPIQQKWYEQIKEKVNERNLFYLTNSFNAQESAVSTFIGIKFNKDNAEWEAMIVGDSCLFHKSDSGFKSYLIEDSGDFTNHPDAFASFARDNHFEPSFESRCANPGDTFILATDALAKWILEHKEAGELDAALSTLREVKTDEQFYEFVHKARHSDPIRLVNDDVTLMLISVGGTQGPKDTGLEVPSETQTQEPTQQQQDILSRILSWGIFAGVFAFFVGFIILLLILFDKK
jgi:hypothetical protein